MPFPLVYLVILTLKLLSEFDLIITILGTSGKLELTNYGDNRSKLWKVESNCNKTRIFSTLFDTEEEYDLVTIDGTMYSGVTVLDLMVPNTFFVGFSSDSENTYSGFVLLWECHDQGDLTCLNSSHI